MRNKLRVTALMFLALFSMRGSTHAQVQQQNRSLVINGQRGEASVVQINGRTYVDLETMVRIANGSVGFQANQIILTLPAPVGAPPGVPAQNAANDAAFSREFMRAAIEDMALMREWASTLANAIQNGYPVTDSWVAAFRQRAAQGLRLASVSASTNGDRSGLQLLTNGFEAVRKWSNKLVQARESMDAANYAMSASALQDDPLSQKIVACGRFLGPMLASGSFQDDGSCH
jgi:hypothetical protein